MSSEIFVLQWGMGHGGSRVAGRGSRVEGRGSRVEGRGSRVAGHESSVMVMGAVTRLFVIPAQAGIHEGSPAALHQRGEPGITKARKGRGSWVTGHGSRVTGRGSSSGRVEALSLRARRRRAKQPCGPRAISWPIQAFPTQRRRERGGRRGNHESTKGVERHASSFRRSGGCPFVIPAEAGINDHENTKGTKARKVYFTRKHESTKE
jgi:hypothetical protein